MSALRTPAAAATQLAKELSLTPFQLSRALRLLPSEAFRVAKGVGHLPTRREVVLEFDDLEELQLILDYGMPDRGEQRHWMRHGQLDVTDVETRKVLRMITPAAAVAIYGAGALCDIASDPDQFTYGHRQAERYIKPAQGFTMAHVISMPRRG